MPDLLKGADTPRALTVSQLNRQVKSLLESHFDYIWVEGELGNFSRPSSGHWYFSLKDADAQVRCAMFRNRNQRITATPRQGDLVRVRGRVSLYEGRGDFQLIVEHLEPAGAGSLQAAFEKLKARLLAEGLFDPARKQPLPEQVTSLGVITSASGAAIHDILTVLRRRNPAIDVSILPVPVQGAEAAGAIAAAIERANRWHREGRVRFDVLVVGRGGGSLEDLWAFNEERVARAIAASDLPVVSAVGHEVDFTIADMVADQRAATPSAAAELLSQDRAEQLRQLQSRALELSRLARRRLAGAALHLGHLGARLKHPGARLREQTQRCDELEQRLLRAQRHLLGRRQAQFEARRQALLARSPLPPLRQKQRDITELQRRLLVAAATRLQSTGSRLGHLAAMLDSLSPLTVLQRGYAILTDSRGRAVKDSSQVARGDLLEARLARGRLGLEVRRVDREA